MNRVFLSFLSVLFFASCCTAQEKTPGFDFLKKFEGKWLTVPQVTGEDEEAPDSRSTVTGELMGEFWLVLRHSGQMGEMKFKALQTVGYNAKQKKYVGTWVDSIKDYMWQYSGYLDDSNRLVLPAKGPDWNDESVMRDYRDIYEFTSENEILATSQMKNDDGKWETFMTAKMTKQIAAITK